LKSVPAQVPAGNRRATTDKGHNRPSYSSVPSRLPRFDARTAWHGAAPAIPLVLPPLHALAQLDEHAPQAMGLIDERPAERAAAKLRPWVGWNIRSRISASGTEHGVESEMKSDG